MKPAETIALFDAFLAERALVLEAVVIGGAALGLLGVVSRQTRDCDILHPALPQAVRDAAREFAAARRRSGAVLVDDWLNNGPASLANDLPNGWQRRLQPVFSGRALTLLTLGRLDLLMSKLFALCDRGLDLLDCVALAPTEQDLSEIMPWLVERDANPGWPAHVEETITDLRRRMGHAA
jgi:hypothetical protein